MVSYVNNCTATFNLDADAVVYLRDIGVPGDVITGMMQHDQQLRGQSTAAVPQTEPPAQGTLPPPIAAQPEPQPSQPVEAPLTPSSAAAPADSVFYNALAPYGTWINVDGYGLCWQPTAVVTSPSWSPYWDGGRWVYTDAGWYWYSDYSWGWAPFHYGRWFCHARFGWCWEPDVTWGPAWVSWRCNDAFCGWAPLGPDVCFSVGVGLTFGPHCWHDWDRPWCHHFVAWGDFRDRDLWRHGVGRSQVTQIYNHTVVENRVSVYNHVTINQGIARDRVMAATHTEVRPVALHETSKLRELGRAEQLDPARGRLTVFRPSLPQPGRTAGGNFASGRAALQARNAAAPGVSHAASPVRSFGNGSDSGSSLRVVGQRSATPIPVTERPFSATARREQATSETPRPGIAATAFRQTSRPESGIARPPGVPQSIPSAVSSTKQLPPGTAETPNRFGTRNLTGTYSSRQALSTPPATQNYYNRPRNEAPVVRQSNPPVYQSAARPAPATRTYDPTPRQFSALSDPSQTRGAASAPRYNAPVRQYAAPSYAAPARSATTQGYNFSSAPRYNSFSSYTPQRSYGAASLPSAPQPRYNNAPSYMPQRSYSAPSWEYHSAPMASPHFSAPASPSSSGGSSFGPGSSSSGGFSPHSQNSDHGPGRR